MLGTLYNSIAVRLKGLSQIKLKSVETSKSIMKIMDYNLFNKIREPESVWYK